MADFRIRVIVDPSGAVRGSRRSETALNRIGKAATRVQRLITGMFAIGTLSIGLTTLARTVDSMTNLENRMRLITTTATQVTNSMEALFEVSDATRASFNATGIIYTRVGLAVKQLGVSTEELLQFTRSLNQAVILSGASTREAVFGLIQLSQGLASGALRGDEMRAVLEQLPAVADVIAKGMGVTRGALRELGAEGKVSAQIVLDAFRKAAPELEELFAKTTPTIEQSLAVLGNEVTHFIGRVDDAFGNASGAFASMLIGMAGGFSTLAEHADTVVRVVSVLTTALTALFVKSLIVKAMYAFRGQLFALALAFEADTLAAFSLSVALDVLRGALLAVAANPLTAVAAALGIAIGLVATMESNTQRVTRVTGELRTVIDRVTDAYKKAHGEIRNIADELRDLTISQAMEDAAEATKLYDRQLGLLATRVLQFQSQLKFAGVEALPIATQVRDGSLALDDFIATIDRLAQENPKLQRTFNGLIEIAQGARELKTESDKAEAAVRLMAGTATDADRRLLGLEDAALAAGYGLDSMASAADGASGSLRTLQGFIPVLDQAATVRSDLAKADAALRQGMADVAEGRRMGTLTALDEVAAVDALTQTYRQARLEITGEAEARRDAADALADYMSEVDIDTHTGEARAVARATMEYEALVQQLTAAGASQDDLNAAQAAYRQELANIHRDETAGGGTSASVAAIVAELEKEHELLLLNNQERELETQLMQYQKQLADDNVAVSERELELIRMKIRENQQLEATMGLVGDAVTTVFGGIDDAVAEFIRTGEFNFGEFARNIVADLAQIAVEAMLVKPLIAGITGMFGGSGFTFEQPDLSSLFSNLSGHQFGGSVVGGSGGPDSQLYVTRVSPGERVDFTPEGKGSANGDGNVIVQFNITTPDVDGFRRSQSQLAAKAARVIGSGRRNM